eukprot:TRINITY_DN4194_c0_g2_i2.p1 TRINITY_DN4194_c0_g2~~TRINITY_DN4194_c0_g2_i2.p1  ORF type:complete len:394 (-),score=54.76 TRINITY_DN4194_c0_g2_i2:115-1296(-)
MVFAQGLTQIEPNLVFQASHIPRQSLTCGTTSNQFGNYRTSPPVNLVDNLNEYKTDSKKRKRDYLLPSTEMLTKISSKEYDDAIKQIEKLRPLTELEQLEIKKQRRQLKNREYAKNSRSKKKQRMENIQESNEKLVQEKNELRTTITVLERENQRLTNENTQLKVFLGNIGYTIPMINIPPLRVPPQTTAGITNAGGNGNSGMTTINFDTTETSTPINYIHPPLLNTPVTRPTQHGILEAGMGKAMGPVTGMGVGFRADENGFPRSNNPFATICLYTIVFSFGFFFSGLVETIPGLETELDRNNFVSTGRALFGSDVFSPLQRTEASGDGGDSRRGVGDNGEEVSERCDPHVFDRVTHQNSTLGLSGGHVSSSLDPHFRVIRITGTKKYGEGG